METPHALIALLTDFGLEDAYVSMMKGVLLTRAPHARIVDITHQIPAQNVQRAGLLLKDAATYLPPGSIHLAVVDPGVGTDRSILAAATNDRLFVAPDNGLLHPLLSIGERPLVVRVTRSDLFLQSSATTFHGRDRMAPVAAALACGLPLQDLGPVASEWVTLTPRQPELRGREIIGEVLLVDHFGNAATNIGQQHLRLASLEPDRTEVHVNRNTVLNISRTYADVGVGESLTLLDSAGRLEIAVRNGSAADRFALRAGHPVRVKPTDDT